MEWGSTRYVSRSSLVCGFYLRLLIPLLFEVPEAIKWLSKAFDTMQDAEIAAHLGAALWMSGQTEKAKNIWVKGEDLGGNQTVLRDTIQSFQQ